MSCSLRSNDGKINHSSWLSGVRQDGRCKQLAANGYGNFIDHNHLLTVVADMVGDDDGIYDDIHGLEQAMAAKLLDQHQDAIVARGFSSLESLAKYTLLASQRDCAYVIIRLQTSLDVLKQRVQSPERLEDFNPTTSTEVLDQWITHNRLEDHPNEYVTDADRELGVVVADIKQFLDER